MYDAIVDGISGDGVVRGFTVKAVVQSTGSVATRLEVEALGTLEETPLRTSSGASGDDVARRRETEILEKNHGPKDNFMPTMKLNALLKKSECILDHPYYFYHLQAAACDEMHFLVSETSDAQEASFGFGM